MVPVAPALFSTTMVAPPSFSPILLDRMRAIWSVEPPGGKGTTRVMGLSGQAKALRLVVAATSRVIRDFFMGVDSGWVERPGRRGGATEGVYSRVIFSSRTICAMAGISALIQALNSAGLMRS